MEQTIVPVEKNNGELVRDIKKNTPIKNNIFKRSHFFVEDEIDFRRGSQSRSGLKLTLWSWMSAFIDTLILISISCFTVVLFAFLMKTPLRDSIKAFSGESSLFSMFFTAFLFSFWVYLTMMRIFMGASLGEWSCQLRLGQPIQRIKTSYIFKVMARTTLILCTGVVILPLISLIIKRDILGDLTGLRIYSLT